MSYLELDEMERKWDLNSCGWVLGVAPLKPDASLGEVGDWYNHFVKWRLCVAPGFWCAVLSKIGEAQLMFGGVN
jgi:hypothetical protein